ncbi:MAG TPA: hypothetical protein GX005_09045 [Bacteroidales bacterium]|nr:hypothetical protein [Bacteroidales bacterium]
MMKLIVFISLVGFSIFLANGQEDRSKIRINDICVEHLCFGDSIIELINSLGAPDSIIYRPIGDEEFEEPSHNLYLYGNDLYYELLYPNLTQGLLYGCRISKIGFSILIGDVKMIIGETRIETMQEKLSKYHFQEKRMNETEFVYSFYVLLPCELDDVKSAFVSEVQLFFTNDILRQIWTPLDKN